MIALGALFWTTTGGSTPPPVRTRGSIDARRERLQAIQRDDEEIMTLAALMVTAMGDLHGD